MKIFLAFLGALIAAQHASAAWKEKTWQCYGEISMISITEDGTRVKQEFWNPHQSIHYYKNLSEAFRYMHSELSEKVDAPGVCSFKQVNHADMPMSYGYWYKEGENKTHDFWLPLNWVPYDSRVRKISTQEKYTPGEYRVCNFSCKVRHIDPDREDIVFHE